MVSIYHFTKRVYNSFIPSDVPKSSDAVRFGILGAANIGPMAFIIPAKTHPDVIVAAVAARDQKKAEAYAKKHGIPVVHKSYQDLLDDPSLDAVYIPLPNGLHYEWGLKALQAGKHVLLEKPSTSNAEEAKSLFRHPLLNQPNVPVLLEAFHYRFHPAWQTFLSTFDSKDIVDASAVQSLPAGFFPDSDIRFNYALSGGTLMDFGTYAINCIRQVFREEPVTITEASHRPMPKGGNKEIDHAIKAKWNFPNGGVGSIEADLAARGGYRFPRLTKSWPKLALPKLTVQLSEKEVLDPKHKRHMMQRTVVFWNMLGPHLYHRIDIIDRHAIRNTENDGLIKSWCETNYMKVYEWPKKENGKVGQVWWTTYRHQLEEFINRIKKREGSGMWVDAEDSVRQMEMIDATYLKAGLPLRPTSKYLSSVG